MEALYLPSKQGKRGYVRYAVQDRIGFFDMKIKKFMGTSAVAKQLGIHIRTAQRWVKQYSMCLDSIFQACKQVGRKCILGKEHKAAVINFIDANPFASVVKASKHLLKRLGAFKAQHSTLYNFMRSECNLSLKKAGFHSIERNSPTKIEERHNWACKWRNTDMDLLINCVFLDEPALTSI